MSSKMSKSRKQNLEVEAEVEKGNLNISSNPSARTAGGVSGDEDRLNSLERLVERLSTRLEVVEAENVSLKATNAQLERNISAKEAEDIGKVVKNDADDDDDDNDEEPVEDSISSIHEVAYNPPGAGNSDLVQFASIMQSSHARAPTLKDLELESIKLFMRAYEEYQIQTDLKILKAPQRFMRSDELAAVSEFTGLSLTQLMAQPTEIFWKSLCKLHGVNHTVEIPSRFKEVKMANDDMVLTTFVKYVKEFDFQLMCLGDKVVVSQRRLVKFFIKGLRPKALAETVEFQLPETLVDAKRLAKQALPELRFTREQAKRFAVIDSDSKSGVDKPKGNQKPLNSSPPSQSDLKGTDLSEVTWFICG